MKFKLIIAVVFICTISFLAKIYIFSNTNENFANQQNDSFQTQKKYDVESKQILKNNQKSYSEALTSENNNKSSKLNIASVEHNSQSDSITNLDSLIETKNGQVFFNSEPLESMNKDELTLLISSLPNAVTTTKSENTKDELSNDIFNYKAENESFIMHDIQCSDVVCGMLFEADKTSDVQNILNQITSENSFKTKTRGGTLRILEEDGVYYGLIVASIADSKLTIR